MSFWTLISIVFHSVGTLAFGGGLLWFVLVLGYADRAHGREGARIADDVFRVTSLAMSLGLAALIFGGLLRYYLAYGHFAWGVGSLHESLNLAKILLFLVQWVAWGWLEVVILHDLRRNIPEPGQAPEPSYERARGRLRRALKWQLVLFTVVMCLGAAGAATA